MTTTDKKPAYRVLGTTNDVTTCDLCGREDLKGTVALAPLDADGNAGEAEYMGSDCAARALRWTRKQVNEAAKSGDRAAAEAKRQEQLDRWRADRPQRVKEFLRWSAWVAVTFREPIYTTTFPRQYNGARMTLVGAIKLYEAQTGRYASVTRDPANDDHDMPYGY